MSGVRGRTVLVACSAVAFLAVVGVLVPLLVAGSSPEATPKTAAGPSISPDAGSAAASTAVTLLRRSAQASSATPFSGTQYVSSWSPQGSASAVVDVEHRPGAGTTVTLHGRTASADSTPSGTLDHTVLSDAIAGGAQDDTVALLVRNYDVGEAAATTCAGRPAQIVEARTRGSGEIAGRFWIDTATGVVLRRELYDSTGRTVRAAAFVDARMASGPAPSPTPSTSDTVTSSDASKDAAEAATLRRQGWAAPASVPGGLTLYDVARTATPHPTVHLSYSDGLFSVSVFAQRGRLDDDSVRGWRRSTVAGTRTFSDAGLDARTVWSDDSTVYTAMGDLPADRLAQVISGFPRSTGSDEVDARIGRGLDRMWSWVS